MDEPILEMKDSYKFSESNMNTLKSWTSSNMQMVD